MVVEAHENPFVSIALAQASPQEAQKIAQALRRNTDNAPGAQAATNVLPQASLDQLTARFDVTRIPISRLKQMMRDPMIAFALFFIRAQILRARWSVQCSDAPVAAFVDQALREIYPSYVSQYMMKLVFGYQAMVKRFELRPGLDWTYMDPLDETNPEKLIWDQGSIDPLVWKPFAALPPETVDPLWTPDGEFNGIKYKPTATSGTAGQQQETEFDVLHALWATNDKETVHGSLWGYPRIGYAYRFWWSFWFNWGLADRHFEKDADPPAIVYYPANKPDLLDASGNKISRRQLALNIGDKARSNSTIALPSDLQVADDGTTKNMREWEIEFAKGGGNFDAFAQRFDQLQVLILRACMIPEQAFLEGKGGCLLGDTPILCPRDHQQHPEGVPLDQMRPGDLVWSFNEQTSKFELRPVKNVWMTMKDADVYKLTLDDGTTITGTPDHPFMSRDGVWREMIDLRPGDRLMPLYEDQRRRYYDGRTVFEGDFEPTVCLDPDRGNFECEYRVVAEAFGWTGHGKKLNVHHEDERHANTHPSNLTPLDPADHARRHFADEHWKAIFRSRVAQGMAEMEADALAAMSRPKSDAHKAKLAQAGREAMLRFKESMTPDEWAQFCSERSRKGFYEGKMAPRTQKRCQRCENDFLPVYGNQRYCESCVEPQRQPFMGRVKRPQSYKPKACESCERTYTPRSGSQKRCDECMVAVRNHRVVSVEYVGKADVWDIEIDGPEWCKNYVAGGVVVHNTSSRNVAGELQDAFQASQIVLMQELDFDLNRFVIPQLVAANFPEKQVKALKITKGFDTQDIDLAKVIIQGAANKDVSQLELDLPAMVDAVGLPRLSPAAIAKKNAEIAAQAQQTTPELQPAQPGQAGVTQEGLYYNPREVIHLSSVEEDARAQFMAELVQVGALRDPTILGDAQRLRTTWQTSLSYDLAIANNLLHDYKDNLDLDETFLERFFRRAKSRAHETAAQTRRSLANIMRRASTTEFEKVGLNDFSWDPRDSLAASKYLSERADVMTDKITATTRDQVKTFLAEQIRKGTPSDQLPALLSAHFKLFSGWRADQIVRTEVSKAYNMATLLAAQDAGIKQVQAIDAQLGPDRSDPECIARNGRVYTLAEAFVEQEKEHPNGTLQWRILRKPVTVKRLPVPKGRPAPILASYEEHDEEIVVTLSEALNERQANTYLLNVMDKIELEGQLARTQADAA